MKRFFVIFFLIFGLMIFSQDTNAAVVGGIEYKIPIDYEKLSQEELETKADFYYLLARKNAIGEVDRDMTNALVLYTILTKKCPDNTFYFTRLGVLYDLCNRDKYAKSNFSRAISEDSSKPETYFYFGEFFYRRLHLKKALNMYKQAYKKGFNNDYQTIFKIGDIYEKLGDTEAALKYFYLAREISPNEELEQNIIRAEQAHQINKEYYSDSRIEESER